ncbi:MAG: hypothetical protein KatS3mg080_0774 [Anoxybacillus sp.]|nr:MAG: hypothetical protein KatS3mg080_0774 [Anoxybacillus sp.]
MTPIKKGAVQSVDCSAIGRPRSDMYLALNKGHCWVCGLHPRTSGGSVAALRVCKMTEKLTLFMLHVYNLQLAWKADQPMAPEHLHCVLSTDWELGDKDILRYYAQRRTIECFFRQAKDQLKLDGYRVPHIRAVKRYWAVGALLLRV